MRGLIWSFLLLESLPLGRTISYPGGYDGDGRRCVDICQHASGGPVCFSESFQAGEDALQQCSDKAQRPGDWDYCSLEQLLAPQYCRHLQVGIDDTVSHQDVDKWPKGAQCLPSRVPDSLILHGLWPDYFDRYPSCCRPEFGLNAPLDPLAFQQTYPTVMRRMENEWQDPTAQNTSQALCGILNHEFQKHGYCLGYQLDTQDSDASAERYFSFTLDLVSRLQNATDIITEWVRIGRTPNATELRGLYPKYIQLYCSRGDSEESMTNRLSSVRTCWGRKENGEGQREGGEGEAEGEESWGDELELEMMDCPAEKDYGNFVRCSDKWPVRLVRYVDPKHRDKPTDRAELWEGSSPPEVIVVEE